MTTLAGGPFETPRWSSFLELLRTMTGAEFATLVFQPPGRPIDDGLQLVADDIASTGASRMYRKYISSGNTDPQYWPEFGKPFSLNDLLRFDKPYHDAYYREVVDQVGICDAWQVRVREPRGVVAWLSVARQSGRILESTPNLLQAIAPALCSVVRGYVAAKSAQLEIKMASEAVRRLQYGWLLLDREGYVVAADRLGRSLLANSDVLSRSRSGRLIVRPITLEREIMRLLAGLAGFPQARPRAITLRSDPWLDMLLIPARHSMISKSAKPAAIAYIHRDNWHSSDRCSQLVDLFGLSPSEARLALALCRGKSLTEAAVELDITADTARSYSKLIYAKTGTRGMVDLVRVIMGSVLALAPEV